ncbi:MAG: nucleotidyltransferase [Actinomycetota bacterium]
MRELGRALKQVAGALERAGVPYMVIGGLANLAWGEPRTTMDVDITVDTAGTGIAGILELAKELGSLLAENPEEVAERGRLVPIRTAEGVRVDMALATLPFELDAIARARVIDLEGVEIPVCVPEDLIVMKSVSRRARDHEDVIGILRRQRGSLALARLDQTISELAVELGEQALAERWQKARRAAGI